jgi:hypothetical protein
LRPSWPRSRNLLLVAPDGPFSFLAVFGFTKGLRVSLPLPQEKNGSRRVAEEDDVILLFRRRSLSRWAMEERRKAMASNMA